MPFWSRKSTLRNAWCHNDPKQFIINEGHMFKLMLSVWAMCGDISLCLQLFFFFKKKTQTTLNFNWVKLHPQKLTSFKTKETKSLNQQLGQTWQIFEGVTTGHHTYFLGATGHHIFQYKKKPKVSHTQQLVQTWQVFWRWGHWPPHILGLGLIQVYHNGRMRECLSNLALKLCSTIRSNCCLSPVNKWDFYNKLQNSVGKKNYILLDEPIAGHRQIISSIVSGL